MSYSTYYTSSNGHPSNNERTHESLADAINSWKSNIGALILRSGGKSVLVDNDDSAELVWVEHCEGGYVYATGGAWEDDISQAAQIAREDGETLTAEKAADVIDR